MSCLSNGFENETRPNMAIIVAYLTLSCYLQMEASVVMVANYYPCCVNG